MTTVYDAANAAVRALICGVSSNLGNFGDNEKQLTRAAFDNQCPYTGSPLFGEDGQPLAGVNIEWDHATPINRTYCGLHIVGNLLPTGVDTHRRKGNRTFEEFLRDEDPNTADARIESICNFRNRVDIAYEQHVAAVNNLPQVVKIVYRQVVAMLEATIKELGPEQQANALAPEEQAGAVAAENPPPPWPDIQEAGWPHAWSELALPGNGLHGYKVIKTGDWACLCLQAGGGANPNFGAAHDHIVRRIYENNGMILGISRSFRCNYAPPWNWFGEEQLGVPGDNNARIHWMRAQAGGRNFSRILVVLHNDFHAQDVQGVREGIAHWFA